MNASPENACTSRRVIELGVLLLTIIIPKMARDMTVQMVISVALECDHLTRMWTTIRILKNQV